VLLVTHRGHQPVDERVADRAGPQQGAVDQRADQYGSRVVIEAAIAEASGAQALVDLVEPRAVPRPSSPTANSPPPCGRTPAAG
jgi:hypothetical protein